MTIAYLTPPQFQSQPPGRPYSRAIAGICWAVIVCTLGTVFFFNWRASRTEARANAVEEVQLLMTSRIVVGEFHFISGMNSGGINTADMTLQQIQSLATSPSDKLRMVSVIGEIKGPKAALAELERIGALSNDANYAKNRSSLRTIYSEGPAHLSKTRKDALVEDQGWFGQLALTNGLADSDPQRRHLLHEVKIAFLVVAGFEGLVGLAGLAGLVLLVIAIVFISTGRVHLCYRPAAFRTTAFIESFAIYLSGFVLIGLMFRLLPHHLNYTWQPTAVAAAWTFAAMLWPLARGLNWAELKGGFGWYKASGIFREAGAGLVGYFAGLPLIFLSVFITMRLMHYSHTVVSHPIMFADTKTFWDVAQIYILAAILAPLIEETMFRGALFNHLRQWHRWLIPALLSAFIFAALHPQGWPAIPLLGCIGFVFAGIREWRGTFIASATAHAVHNATAVTLMVLALR